jgi:hypothetical protein
MACESLRSGRFRANGRANEGVQRALPPDPNSAETREPLRVQVLFRWS